MRIEEPGRSGGGADRRFWRLEASACAAVAVLAFVLYTWSALQLGGLIGTREPDGYYPFLTAGFRSGHLYVAIEPNPQLLALPDPYDPVANAPYRIHDMTLYRGHYYLYYGVTPAVILFWPVASLTGWYVSEPFAVALFCAGAVSAGIALLLAIRRRYFPSASPVALVGACVCLAFATPLLLLVEAPQFYQVPISCAIFLQALMLCAVYRAIHSARRSGAWFAAAGLLYGLSVGARPNYILGVAAVLIPAAWVAMGDGADPAARRRRLRAAALCVLGPAAGCGAALMLYNWMRFGSVAEFGMHYQLAGERESDLQALKLSNLLPHLRGYLFGAGNWRSYFPYFGSRGYLPYGLLRYAPWAWLAAAGFLPVAVGGPQASARLRVFGWSLAAAALINLLFLSSFYGITYRYPGDYANAGLLLAGVGALALSQGMSARGRAAPANALLCAAVAVSLLFALAAFASSFPRKGAFFAIGRVADTPGYLWQRAHGVQFGGLRLELRLPAAPATLPEPIFETGLQSDQRDWVQIDYPSPGRARLGLFHAGAGLFQGADFPIPADRRVVVEAALGSLLPPFSHPVFGGWTLAEFERERGDVRICANGVEVLRAALACYESSPSDLRIGRLGWFTGGMAQEFSGGVTSVSRTPLLRPAPLADGFHERSPIELSLYLPALGSRAAEPLLATGKGAESDLLYCVYDGAERVRFALDHFGSGGPRSEVVPFDALRPHTLLIWMGSIGKGADANRLGLVFDGRVLLNSRQPFYPASPESSVVGLNPFGSTTAEHRFTGTVLAARQVSLAELPPLPKGNAAYGAIEMSVRLPDHGYGSAEPLVVTGSSGAGDFAYVRYVDSGHILVGFDHWGVGGSVSQPIGVDYGKVHRIGISMDSLYGGEPPPGLKGTVRVTVDGAAVLNVPWSCYPSPADEITVGKNEIGGSTCGPAFTGTVLRVDRFAAPQD